MLLGDRVTQPELLAEWAEKYFSAQSEEWNSTTSGTGSVRISSQGFFSTKSKLSPKNILSSQLVAPGFPRMISVKWLAGSSVDFKVSIKWLVSPSVNFKVSIKWLVGSSVKWSTFEGQPFSSGLSACQLTPRSLSSGSSVGFKVSLKWLVSRFQVY